MKVSLLKYLNQHSSLSDEELNKLVELFRTKEISKGDFWIRQDELCNDIAFLVSGILRMYYTKDDEEITIEFNFPNSFTTAFGCSTDNKSPWNYQAIVDCKLLLVDKSLHREVIINSLQSFEFYEEQLNRVYANKERKLISLLHLKAEERFEMLFKEQPEIFNLVPLKFIASNLGITPETLSRLRKKLVKDIS